MSLQTTTSAPAGSYPLQARRNANQSSQGVAPITQPHGPQTTTTNAHTPHPALGSRSQYMPPVRRLTDVAQGAGSFMKGLFDSSRAFLRKLYEKYGPPPEPDDTAGGQRPHNSTVVRGLLGFMLLAGIIAIAAAITARWKSSQWTKLTAGVIGLVLLLCLVAMATFDVYFQSRSKLYLDPYDHTT